MPQFYNHIVNGAPLDLGAFLGAACDAGQVLAAAEALKSVEARLFERPVPPLKSSLLVFRKFDAGAWATHTSFMTLDKAAKMKRTGGLANDAERVVIGTSEKTSPVHEFGVAYGYGRKELAIAAKLGMALDDIKARVAMEAYETCVDELACYGDQGAGLTGLLSPGNGVPRINSTTAIDSSSTPLEIMRLLNDAASSVVLHTEERVTPDTLALPLKAYQYIFSTPFSTTDSRSILTVFLTNNPYIRQVIPWNRLAAKGDPVKDKANRHLLLVMRRLDETICRQQIPEPFMMLDPQVAGTETVINCVASIGSVEIIQPKGICLYQFPNNDAA